MPHQKPRPIAEGNFEKTPFAHILVYLLNKKLTGTLEVSDTFNHINIYFREGMPAKVTTTVEGKQLGQVLVEMGLISSEQLLVAQKEMATRGGLQGQILLGLGYINAAQLVAGISHQMMLKLLDVFALGPAGYAFYQKVNLLAGAGPAELLQLDTFALLMAGARQHGIRMQMDEVLRTLDSKVFFLNDARTLGRFNLTRPERMLCRLLLEKPRTFEELESLEDVDLRTIRAALYVFLITRTLVVREPGQVDMGESPAPGQRLDSIAPPPPTRNSYPPEILELRNRIQEKAVQLPAQNYFEMLEVDRNAPADDARKAFFKLAKVFHPDRASSDDLKDLKGTLDYIFTNLSEAHSTLIDPDAREEYEAAILSGSGRTSVTPESNEETQVRELLEAEALYQKSIVLMRRQKYEQAFEFMDRAHEINPNEGTYIATWAYLRMLLHDKDKPADLIPHFRSAAELSPRSDRVHLYFGYLLKKLDRMGEARQEFEKVLDLKPNHIEAARELRIINMRQERASTGKRKGLFGKFLK